MNEITEIDGQKQDETPYYCRLPMEVYHRSPGISKSGLDWIHCAPALLEWSRNAPVDEDAKSAVNIGTAFHTFLLEPERFGTEYVADFRPPAHAIVTVDDLQRALNERGLTVKASASKGALTRQLLDADPEAPVSDAMHAEWERGIGARKVLTAGEFRKLELMRDSVMAHPIARQLMEMEGPIEQSHFWHDEETGELCRCRPDKSIPLLHCIVDVKTTADADKHAFGRSIQEYRYYVQDPFYMDGYTATVAPCQQFLFLAISTTRDRARYPVRVYSLPEMQREIGRGEYRQDLRVYAECRASGEWDGVEEASLPDWFMRQFEGGMV